MKRASFWVVGQIFMSRGKLEHAFEYLFDPDRAHIGHMWEGVCQRQVPQSEVRGTLTSKALFGKNYWALWNLKS